MGKLLLWIGRLPEWAILTIQCIIGILYTFFAVLLLGHGQSIVNGCSTASGWQWEGFDKYLLREGGVVGIVIECAVASICVVLFIIISMAGDRKKEDTYERRHREIIEELKKISGRR